MELTIREFSSKEDGFRADLDALLAWDSVSDANVQTAVANIVTRVRAEGDDAVIEFTNQFDRRSVGQAAELEISREQMAQAKERISPELVASLEAAAARVHSYHERQNNLLGNIKKTMARY